ncbi:MAG TPA: gliding motility-associated C-terminal domain-containing protein, partial [Bacteroidales bacterium]|nr:gliding motility-associated C-terminal domain-containing protein [Bacteroidales bacterium]
TWTNSNTDVGLGAGGTGDIPAFTAENTTNSAITATITITPSSNGCDGIPETYIITVNPIPTVTPVVDQVYCIGSGAPVTELTGPTAGTVFSWTNNNTAIGLGASGTGDVPSFTAQNTTGTTLAATITITPSANGCVGEPETYNITVYATSVTPNLVSMIDADCLGKALGALDIEVVGGESPYTYAWSNGAITEDIEGLDAGVYEIIVTDNKGCTSKDTSFQIVARPETPLKLNNVFSPNGDGKNDMWVIGNIELYPENEIFVYNRWGNQVYSEKGYNNEKPLIWDGSNLTEGTYLYVLKINMCGVDKTYKDYITIVR